MNAQVAFISWLDWQKQKAWWNSLFSRLTRTLRKVFQYYHRQTLVVFLSTNYTVSVLWSCLGFGALWSLEEGGANESLFRIPHTPLPSGQSHTELTNMVGGGNFRIPDTTTDPVAGPSGVMSAEEPILLRIMLEYWSQSRGIYTILAPVNSG